MPDGPPPLPPPPPPPPLSPAAGTRSEPVTSAAFAAKMLQQARSRRDNAPIFGCIFGLLAFVYGMIPFMNFVVAAIQGIVVGYCITLWLRDRAAEHEWRAHMLVESALTRRALGIGAFDSVPAEHRSH